MNYSGKLQHKLVSGGVCEKCGIRYNITSDDILIIPGMRLNVSNTKKDYLSTWADWIDHISTNCPDCRFVRPPISCINDLNKIMNKYSEEKQIDAEIERQEQLNDLRYTP